ncbi:hypothetical protein SPICUR_06710 [Spiribacter curvatus]|uniref:UmuC domain-containing protein n=1 Tax=Spiribacter curvatus TaxID=1335757 RepID=U5T4U5_9GAMM|nr:DNA polymerase Y family protein [Spiribacter curvatus]AGY92306.1 hypothetical protein SPICUR_06710 [Spiribacter curvatus]
MLWLCLHLFKLPVECFRDAEGEGETRPLFVSQAGRVIGGNQPARRLGIRPGMTPTAARALTEDGRHQLRDPDREQRTLERLATWAVQFTPRVSIEPPTALLLEIEGSLRYFHGMEPLRRRILDGLEQWGHQAGTGIAPTPTGAWMLARAGDGTPVTARSELAERLAALSVDVLPLGQRATDALQGLGCETVGALRALPSDGATRRLGRTLLETLQRAHGERPDPRRNWQPPAHFERRVDCLEAIAATDGLRPILQQLIDGLCTDLRHRDAGIRRLRFALWHREGRPTRLPLGVLSPTRDAGHLKWLIDRQLDNLTLTADVVAVTLRAGRFHALQGVSEAFDLLDRDDRHTTAADWRTLIETFDSRLGEERVCMVKPLAEHRPERAWCYQRPDTTIRPLTLPAQPTRPTWLLDHPLPLRSPRGRPEYDDAPLLLEAGPERIETGWWDGLDITRDYYHARTAQGRRIWIFRDRRGQRDWYLHGIFA